MIRQIDNKELLSYLKEREAVFQSMEHYVKWDDEKLSHYNRFKTAYNALSQLEKDIWYLTKTLGARKTASLMQVSEEYIRLKMKKIGL